MPYQDLLLTIVPIVFGVIIKYKPELKNFPNGAIPYVAFVLTLLTKIAESFTTGNVTTSIAGYHPVVVASFWGGVGGFLAPVVASGWQAIQNSLIYEVFLRAPVGSVLRKP